jgi:hypothetical protein
MADYGIQSIVAGGVSLIVLYLALYGTNEIAFLTLILALATIILGIIGIRKGSKTTGIIGIVLGGLNIIAMILLYLFNN